MSARFDVAARRPAASSRTAQLQAVQRLYRKRGAVEREFGRLKHEWSLLPLRVRGIDRVRLHADLTIVSKLACALAKDRAADALLAA
jgi:hypothetical protein